LARAISDRTAVTTGGKGCVQIYRLVAALIVLSGIVVAFVALPTTLADGALGQIVNYFSFFTMLTNALIVFALVMPTLWPASALGRSLGRPPVRGAILLYIVVVALVYVMILRNLWNPTGLQAVGNAIIHYAAPILYLFDWVAFVPRGELRWRDALGWVVFPLLYGLYTLAHGAVSGFYPYPFVDPASHVAVLANVGLLVLGLLALGLGIVTVDRFGRTS
jgi:hypothetical protein